MNKDNLQMSETFKIGVLLALVGGFLDAYTFICRDGVFANAQTGNMVLLSIKIAKGDWLSAGVYLIPILAFVLGVVVAEFIKFHYKSLENFHWRQIIILFEILVLLGVAFIPMETNKNILANILISFVCSLQVEAFRKMKGNPFATTMCTGNLRSASENTFKAIINRDKLAFRKSLSYYGIIGFFIIGAIIGSLITTTFSIRAIYVPIILLVMVFIMMFVKPKNLNTRRYK